MKRLSPLAILLPVALLSASYIGSYIAMLRPGIAILASGWSVSCSRVPSYLIDSAATRAAFAPALWFDQHLRPGHWNWTVDLEIATTGADWDDAQSILE